MASKATVDFGKVFASGLGKQTSAELNSFRKRCDEAERSLNALKRQPATVDFAYYKGALKNQDVVAQAEKIFNGFKPVTYNVADRIKAIDSFESAAAEESATKIEAELKDLKETLNNIEGARPFDQLTATDVLAARPEIAKTIEEMMKKGKWSVPGYEEKFGTFL
ncbi:ATP synthase d subunit [Malassezia vespertilionis]|uniref:ATP synthase d subunit n=1 Tax=Malassezia vespertilionis TaxID=2020962 RepID=UPI0024B21A8E|nr:ATP synthase d subunit [Malassezia vespertilionis]WFD07477.1 ATP synthase d subunit [Malassezia vespertilionis]